MSAEVIAIIPARGGSKRIPRKNIKLLAGKPLIAYSIEAALQAKRIGHVFVSTEDPEIAKVAKEYGANVIDRPPALAEDATPTMPVLEHAIVEIEKLGHEIGAIVLLQPTSPLREAEDIDEAIEKYSNSECDSLLSVCEKRRFYWTQDEDGQFKKHYDERVRSQDMDPWYEEDGAIYVSTKDIIKNHTDWVGGRIEKVILDEKISIDIDTEFDFWLAERLLEWKNEKNKNR